jgi:hypothetical protein
LPDYPLLSCVWLPHTGFLAAEHADFGAKDRSGLPRIG